MKLKYTIMYVEDVRKTLDFYTKAFGLSVKFLHESGDYGELETGTTSLAFSSTALMKKLGKEPGKPQPEKPVFEIAFETQDVRAKLAIALAAGAKLVQDVRDEPWGQTTAYVSDPNGYLVEICTPVGG